MNQEIRENIKNKHFSFYEKMGFTHKPDCLCRQWEVKPQSEAEIIKDIERVSFESEDFKPEELGF